MNQKGKRVFMALVGVVITGISVGLFQKASLGVDPYTSFITGISNILGLSFGGIYTAICCVLFVIVFIFDKHYIGLTTILNLISNGFIADMARGYMNNLMPSPNYLTRILLLFIAVIVVCFATSLYFTANLGISVYDAISKIMTDREIASFRVCRVSSDLLCVIIGYLLKVTVGVGTIITALFMGPLIQWFNVKVSKPFLDGNNISEKLL